MNYKGFSSYWPNKNFCCHWIMLSLSTLHCLGIAHESYGISSLSIMARFILQRQCVTNKKGKPSCSNLLSYLSLAKMLSRPLFLNHMDFNFQDASQYGLFY